MIDLRLGDAIEVMRGMADASVDAVVTDPPFGLTDHEWDIAPDLEAFWREAKRIAKPKAAFVIFAIQPFATDLIISNRKAFKYDLVWAKNTAVGFFDVKRKPMRCHEFVLIFGKGFQYNRVDWPRDKNHSRIGMVMPPPKALSGGLYNQKMPRFGYVYRETECPKSVMRFVKPSNANVRSRSDYHPNQKPVDMMKWLVESYSPPGGLVLDPYMGSASTGLACLETGRSFIGIDNDPKSYAIADRRMASARAKTPLFSEARP